MHVYYSVFIIARCCTSAYSSAYEGYTEILVIYQVNCILDLQDSIPDSVQDNVSAKGR